jgi:uncharacterized membrane protein
MLAASRFEMGWSAWRIARFLALRGALIVAISQLIEFPLLALVFVTDANAPPGPAQLFILLGVLFALGACLVLAGILHRLPAAAWLALGAGLLVASNAVVPGPEQADAQFALWQRLLYLPGFAASVVSLYPVLPWFAITCLGVAFGKWTRRAPARAAGGALWIGLGAIASAVALRAAGGFGNITLPRDGSWIEFLNMVKYPPAVVFALWMVGGNLVFFAAFSRFRVAPLEVFGRAPLFFYIAHIALYAVTGALFFRRGATWSVGLPLWAASLVPLYYGCRWFDRFKRSKAPESFWRML